MQPYCSGLGHAAGDELLKGVAQCLEEAFSGIGTCYRMGGDEFLVGAICDREVYLEKEKLFDELVDKWKGKTDSI